MTRLCAVFGLISSLIISGCSSEQGPNLGARLLASRSETVPAVDPRFAALNTPQTPLLFMGIEARQVAIGLLLETQRDGYNTYRAEDGVTISLNRGILSATRGFFVVSKPSIGDLMSVDARQTQALLARRATGEVERFHTYLNGEGRTVFRSYVCDVTDEGPGEVTIDGVTSATWVMDESCDGPNVSFQNTYWLGRSNQILQSRQWVSPPTGSLQMQEISR